jgi:hypothetical protein
VQRDRDRAQHRAANERCPDDSQLFHETLPLRPLPMKAAKITAFDLASLDRYQTAVSDLIPRRLKLNSASDMSQTPDPT